MAGLIPRQFIDELMTRLDIVEVIDGRVPLKKRGREYVACCPFHNEKSPSFTVSSDKQFYHCFGCGANGSALGFVMEYERLSFPEAVEELAGSLGMEVPREEGAPDRPKVEPTLYDALAEANLWFQRQLRDHAPTKDYLKQRGLSGETAQRFGLGYAPDGWQTLVDALNKFPPKQLQEVGLAKQGDRGNYYGMFRDRVMFPIRDRRGRVIGFGGRVMGDGEPKYLNSPETPVFHKGRELYGLFEAREANRELARVLVVEGYMDVIALAQHGINYAVATLGTATTPEHLQQLFRFTDDVVFCFDGDRAGRAAGWKALGIALPELIGQRRVRLLFMPTGEDPDTLVQQEGKQAFERRIESAPPLAEVLLEDLASQVDLRNIDGKARLVDLAKPWLEKVNNPALRELMLESLATRSGLSVEKLSRQMKAPSQQTGWQQGNRQEGPPDFGQERQSRAPIRQGGEELQRTPLRRLLSLILQVPQMAQVVEPEQMAELQALNVQGVALLHELLTGLQQHPVKTTGALLEQWREHPHFSHISRLARLTVSSQQLKIDMDLASVESVAREFGEQWKLLMGLGRNARIEQLLAMGNSGQLTVEDKQELNRLLRGG